MWGVREMIEEGCVDCERKPMYVHIKMKMGKDRIGQMGEDRDRKREVEIKMA